MTDEQLMQLAIEAREQAYVPYSKFKVGAAVLTEDGHVYTGCNIENASYGLTNCAERTAIFKAVSEGHRKFQAIAVYAGDGGDSGPCGACRQVIVEWGLDIRVVQQTKDGRLTSRPISELLPGAFTPADLGVNE